MVGTRIPQGSGVLNGPLAWSLWQQRRRGVGFHGVKPTATFKGSREIEIEQENLSRFVKVYGAFLKDLDACRDSFQDPSCVDFADRMARFFAGIAIAKGYGRVSAQPTYEGSVLFTFSHGNGDELISLVFSDEDEGKPECIWGSFKEGRRVATQYLSADQFLKQLVHGAIS